MKSAMRSGVVIVEEVEGQAGIAMPAGAVAAGVGPFPGEGLDEALGFSICLRPIGSREDVFDAEVAAGIPEAVRTVRRAVVSEDSVHFDPMEGVEAYHLLEGADDARDLLVGMDAGEAEPRVVVDGHMKRLDAGSNATVLAVARSADTRLEEAAELLDVEVDELTGSLPLIADDWRRGRIECFQEVDTVAPEYSPDRGLGDGHQHDDLGIGAALPAQSHHVALELGGRAPRLTFRHTGVLAHPFDDPFDFDAVGPASDGLLADTAGGCCLPQCQPLVEVAYHLSSTPRGELGISVHVVRAVGL
jgi:hypothetical protein